MDHESEARDKWAPLNPAKTSLTTEELCEPVTLEEKELLDLRLKDATKNPEHKSPWAEVKKRLRRLLINLD